MSDTTYVPEHKLRQQANAAGVTPANADLHGPDNDGHLEGNATRAPVRCEITASAIPGAQPGETAGGGADGAADPTYGPVEPVNRAWPFNPDDTSPLAWWRTLPSDRLHDSQRLLVNTTIKRIGVMRGGGVLTAALRGEAGAAVAVALTMMPIGDVTLEVDIAMTAVLRCALAGNGPAALVLAHVLGHADIGHPFATELSTSWLTRPLHRSPDRRRFTKQEARLLAALRERDELPAASLGGKA